MKGLGEGQESGKGKVLLSGKGESFIKAARAQPGRKNFSWPRTTISSRR